MPRVRDAEQRIRAPLTTAAPVGLPPLDDKEGFGQVLGAFFRTEINTGSAIERAQAFFPARQAGELETMLGLHDVNVFQDDPRVREANQALVEAVRTPETQEALNQLVQDFPEQASLIPSLASEDDIERFRSFFIQQLEDRQLLAENFAASIAAGLILGPTDPINWVPMVAAASKFRLARIAVANAAAIVATEATLGATQDFRTIREGAANSVAGTVFSTIVGGVGGAAFRGVKAKRAARIQRQMGQELIPDPTVKPAGPKRQGLEQVAPDRRAVAGEAATPEVTPGPRFQSSLDDRVAAIKDGTDTLGKIPDIPDDPDAFTVADLPDIETTSELTGNYRDAVIENGNAPPGNLQTRFDLADPNLQSGKEQKFSLGILNASKLWSPQARLKLSANPVSRHVVQMLQDTGTLTKDLAKGIPAYEAVSSRVRGWIGGPHFESVVEIKRQFHTYKQRIAREGGDALSLHDFNEQVSFARRRKNKHPTVPEAGKAAAFADENFFRRIFDYGKRFGAFPEDISEEFRSTYLHRIYNVRKIAAKFRNDQGLLFEDVVRAEVIEMHGGNLTAKEADDIARGVVRQIMDVPEGRHNWRQVIERGGLKGRTFQIADEKIEPFLENDFSRILSIYTRSVVPDVELHAAFGSADAATGTAAIRDSYDVLREGLSGKDALKLDSLRKRDIADFNIMVDAVRHRLGVPVNPAAGHVKALQGIRAWNFTRYFGAIVRSSVPDVGHLASVHGFSRMFRNVAQPFLLNMKALKMGKMEARRAGAAIDGVLHSRVDSLFDVGDVYGHNTAFDRATETATNFFARATGIDVWNTAMKTAASVMSQERIMDLAERIVKGRKLSRVDREWLSARFIGDAEAKRIWSAFQAALGTGDALEARHGIRVLGLDAWQDADLRQLVRSALGSDADTSIVTPRAGDKPAWAYTPVGKSLLQGRNFLFAATDSALVRMLQQRDMNALVGSSGMVIMGMLVYKLSLIESGREDLEPTTLEGWVAKGLERSGVLAVMEDANQIAEAATGGRAGLSAFAGEPTLADFQAQRQLDRVLYGPTLGGFHDTLAVTLALSKLATDGDGLTEREVQSMYRLLPFQNVFYLRWLLRGAEAVAN